jgi:glycosyltransferase involved in cell wall biosynthesis
MKFELIPGVKKLVYGCGELHKLLGDTVNIGENGSNLTIVILSCNRALSTLKLMTSIEKNIPQFQGTVLVIDNGSFEEELNILKNEMSKFSFKYELVELEKNYGVAGGRNKAIEHIRTDWFMNLDNDIYFTSNPLKKIQKDISELGCKFLNLPLLDESGKKIFVNGGNLFVQHIKGNIHIGCGSLYKQSECTSFEEFDASLSTFLFGGASVINKQTFIECGMFDDNMFIGFEDVDFSITIFKKGYKIGNCGILSLVHDHKIPHNTENIEYEKMRFSSEIIFESALYFEAKHGIKVWDEYTEIWLNEKIGFLNSKKEIKKIIKKPKIALVADVNNWAFSNISREIIKYLSEKYEFKYFVMEDLKNAGKLFLLTKDCDLIHIFWRGLLYELTEKQNVDYLRTLGYININNYINNVVSKLNISTAIYDHLYLNKDIKITNKIFKYVKHYYVSSNKLYNIYNKIDHIKKPEMVITDGVDLNIFYPKNLERFEKINQRKIIVGWVGNSKWQSNIEDFKGVQTILKPAINELINEGYPIEMYFADKNEHMIPHNQMNEYYSNIDLYICTSKVEGTPNPVLEAMACGVPIISTDVGIVNEAFGEKQKQMILEERSIDCLKKKIIYLIENYNLFVELSKENLGSIKSWSWEYKVKDFDKYFARCLKNK